LDELHKHETDGLFLSECLVSVTCDGATVMLGRENGVAKLLLDRFTIIAVWHCLNHRLELSVDYSLREVAGINYFEVTVDKIRSLYYPSPKNQRELNAC
jgi:hypothetical protein